MSALQREFNLPLISIIVPNYNHEKYLRQRLDSVFNQTYDNFEVILLDDCSTDNSKSVLSIYKEHPKVSNCIFNDKNSGNTFIQWNKGISLSKGEYIWIAESDDFCDLNFLEKLIKPLILDKEITLAYCQSNKVNEMNVITGNWIDYTIDIDKTMFLKNFVFDGNEFVKNFLIYKNVIPNASAVIFKKDRGIQLGGLDIDPQLKYCSDWLFYIQVITNYKISFYSQPLNNFRYHSASAIATAKKIHDELYLLDTMVKMRQKMIDFLSKEKPVTLQKIIKKNKFILLKIKLGKALYFIRNSIIRIVKMKF